MWNRIGTSLALALVWLLGRLPLRVLHAVGRGLAVLWRWLPTRERQVASRNLALCFPALSPAESRARLRATLDYAGETLFELPWLWSRPVDRVLGKVRRLHGVEAFHAALAEGRGMILAAPHLGAWELLNLWLSRHCRLALLYRAPRLGFLEAVFNRGRSRAGAVPIRAEAAGVRHLVRHLKEGGVVGILPDQQPKQGEGEFAPFFGIEAFTMTLLPKLAARHQLPVVFAWAERLPRGSGYALHFRRADPLVTDVAALNAHVEQCARALPDQYQWTYKRFSMRPPGAPKIYP